MPPKKVKPEVKPVETPIVPEGRWNFLLKKCKAGMNMDNRERIASLLGPEGAKFGKVFQKNLQAIWHTMDEFCGMFNGCHMDEVDIVTFLEIEIELNRMMAEQRSAWKLLMVKFENPWTGTMVIEPWAAYGLAINDLKFLHQKADRLAEKLGKILAERNVGKLSEESDNSEKTDSDDVNDFEHCNEGENEGEIEQNESDIDHDGENDGGERDQNDIEPEVEPEMDLPELELVDQDDFTSSWNSSALVSLGLITPPDQNLTPRESSPKIEKLNRQKGRSWPTVATATVLKNRRNSEPNIQTEFLRGNRIAREYKGNHSEHQFENQKAGQSLPAPKQKTNLKAQYRAKTSRKNDETIAMAPGISIRGVLEEVKQEQRRVENSTAKKWTKEKRNNAATPPHNKRAKTAESVRLVELTKQLEDMLQLAKEQIKGNEKPDKKSKRLTKHERFLKHSNAHFGQKK